MKHWGCSAIREIIMNPGRFKAEEKKKKKRKKKGLTYICDMMEAVGCEQTVLSRWFE